MILNKMLVRGIFFLFHSLLYVASQDQDELCKINVRSGMHEERPPMLLCGSEHSNRYMYPLPIDPSNLIFNKDQTFHVFCAKKPNNPASQTLLNNGDNVLVSNMDKPAEIKCVQGKKFLLNEQEVEFDSLSCAKTETPEVKEDSSLNCQKGKGYHVGYNIGGDEVLSLMNFCVDEDVGRIHWIHSVLKPIYDESCKQSPDDKPYRLGIMASKIRDPYVKGGPYGLKSQKDLFTSIMNNNAQELDKFFSPKICQKKYLSPAELISHKNKFYRSEQEGVFFFTNVVPMWEYLRSTVWKDIENYSQKLINAYRREFDVLAGGIKTLKIKSKEVYLQNNRVPVPQIVFKCLLDKMTKKGLCFLLVNISLGVSQFVPEKDQRCGNTQRCGKAFLNKNNVFCCTPKEFYDSYGSEVGLESWKEMEDYDPIKLIEDIQDEHRHRSSVGL